MRYSTKRNTLDCITTVIGITSFITVTWWLALVCFALFILTTAIYPINWDKVRSETKDVVITDPEDVYKDEKIRTVEGILV